MMGGKRHNYAAGGDTSSASQNAPKASLSKGWLVIVGAIVFLITGVYAAPASLLAPVLSAAHDVSYQRLEGRIWRGRIKGLVAADQRLGDVAFTIRALPLLLGNVETQLSLTGGVATGGGVVSVNVVSRSLELQDATADFNLNAIDRYTLFGLPYQGYARASVRRLVWNKTGCASADGSFWTDALNAAATRVTGDGIELSGPARCEGDALMLLLDGVNAYGDATIEIAVSPDLTYALSAAVTPKRSEARRSLELLGFQPDGRNLVYDAVGPLKGLGS